MCLMHRRSVPVVSSLINDDKKISYKFSNEIKEEYTKLRENHLKEKRSKKLSNYRAGTGK